MKCPNCGRDVNDNWTVCSYCGFNLKITQNLADVGRNNAPIKPVKASKKKVAAVVVSIIVVLILILAMMQSLGTSQSNTVPHEKAWGIYSLDLASSAVALIYSTDNFIEGLSLNKAGDLLAFAERIGGSGLENEEICKVRTSGSGFTQMTDNDKIDTYPAWSSDGSAMYFLSMHGTDLDICKMMADSGGQMILYDSGYNDADVNAVGSKIVFTRQSQIWSMNADGTGATKVTSPPRAGEWGDANLPFGDYDPRLSPDGTEIVFERLVGDTSANGNYDIYSIKVDGTGEKALTATGYSQGLPSWSHDGDKIVYTVSAINGVGKYRIYMMDSDGGNNRDVTPSYFPADFLCHTATFSNDDSKIYFVGQWY